MLFRIIGCNEYYVVSFANIYLLHAARFKQIIDNVHAKIYVKSKSLIFYEQIMIRHKLYNIHVCYDKIIIISVLELSSVNMK